jgi:hypothetical protein
MAPAPTPAPVPAPAPASPLAAAAGKKVVAMLVALGTLAFSALLLVIYFLIRRR